MNEWMMKLTSLIVLGTVSSIIFEDSLIDVGAWSEVSVQVLVGKNNVFLSAMRHSIFILNVIQEIYTDWGKLDGERPLLSTSSFAVRIHNSLISLFFHNKKEHLSSLTFPRTKSIVEGPQVRAIQYPVQSSWEEEKPSVATRNSVVFRVESQMFPTGSDWQQQYATAKLK